MAVIPAERPRVIIGRTLGWLAVVMETRPARERGIRAIVLRVAAGCSLLTPLTREPHVTLGTAVALLLLGQPVLPSVLLVKRVHALTELHYVVTRKVNVLQSQIRSNITVKVV